MNSKHSSQMKYIYITKNNNVIKSKGDIYKVEEWYIELEWFILSERAERKVRLPEKITSSAST